MENWVRRKDTFNVDAKAEDGEKSGGKEPFTYYVSSRLLIFDSGI